MGGPIALAIALNMPSAPVAASCDPGRTSVIATQTWGSEYNGEPIGGLTEPRLERVAADVDNQISFVEAGGAWTSETRIQMTVSVENGVRIGNAWAYLGLDWRPGQGLLSSTQVWVGLSDNQGSLGEYLIGTLGSLGISQNPVQLEVYQPGDGSLGWEDWKFFVGGTGHEDGILVREIAAFNLPDYFQRVALVSKTFNNGNQVPGGYSNKERVTNAEYDRRSPNGTFVYAPSYGVSTATWGSTSWSSGYTYTWDPKCAS